MAYTPRILGASLEGAQYLEEERGDVGTDKSKTAGDDTAEKGKDGSEESARAINASRDDVVAETLAANDVTSPGGEDQEGDEDEIVSARVRSQAKNLEEEDEEGEEEDDTASDDSEEKREYYERVFQKAIGTKSSAVPHLKQHLSGDIVVALQGQKTGYLFRWEKEELSGERWEGSAPKKSSCALTLSQENLEEILRGKLNPQVAMLSHKVHVQGEMAHAVYFFNLFLNS
ncbi:SCP2 sterol-binding domain-containing protein [bacterium]|nr:SCP2 sterol-binding domain-containing protein [bacterium]